MTPQRVQLSRRKGWQPAEARRIARDLGLRVEFDERPLPDPCTASNVTPLRRTS